MKKIITIITMFFLVGTISAIYPGECGNFSFSEEGIVNWSVEGNSSSMEGFSFTKNETTITYCFHPLFKPDNFTITFYNNKNETIIVDSDDSSSSSKNSKTCKTDWVCSSWTECKDGYKTRICEKEFYSCDVEVGRPSEKESCEILNFDENTLPEININQKIKEDKNSPIEIKNIQEDNSLPFKTIIRIILIITLIVILLGVISYYLLTKNEEDDEDDDEVNDDEEENDEENHKEDEEEKEGVLPF